MLPDIQDIARLRELVRASGAPVELILTVEHALETATIGKPPKETPRARKDRAINLRRARQRKYWETKGATLRKERRASAERRACVEQSAEHNALTKQNQGLGASSKASSSEQNVPPKVSLSLPYPSNNPIKNAPTLGEIDKRAREERLNKSSGEPTPAEYRQAFERVKIQGPRWWGPRFGPRPDEAGYRGPAVLVDEWRDKAQQRSLWLAGDR
jgi:hypothetical protein